MTFTRREMLALTAGASAAVGLPFAAYADEAALKEAATVFTEGAEVKEGGVELTTPEIAENGNTVPIEVAAAGASTIVVLASGNPTPDIIKVTFGPKSGSQSLSTRIRLAGTQNIEAIAKMADGSYASATKEVKVTIGGCGG